eukprot:TRINITY_DN5541_c0_g1_i1.p1 TRINITY_DN5541_c0_g1~~TRINITY_DN5541_c0_g1_i1.p1  ORF type:complete len:533 (+),score=91.50 TRINITY_DN5541_c0_g1_i1:66-1664(+)
MLFSFGHLKDTGSITTGEPVYCKKCSAVLSTHSKLITNEDEFLWACEFCGEENNVDDDILSGAKEPLNYILETPSTASKKETSNSPLIIFLMDTSGSMSQTTFVNDTSSLNLPSLKDEKEGRYISRLQFLQSAFVAQIKEIQKTSAKCRVGLITFASNVTIHTSKSAANQVIEGDILNDYAALLEKGYDFDFQESISDCSETLQSTVLGLSEGGSTALGPALVIGCAIAAKTSGSKCVLLTDGCANIGVGKLTTRGAKGGQSEDFYGQVGEFAKRKGTVLSVVSIKGSDTRLEELGKLADLSKGIVDLVDPNDLSFSGLLSSEVFGTNVQLKIYLPNGWRFKYEDKSVGRILEKDMGNATSTTQIAAQLEYVGTKEKAGEKALIQIQIVYRLLNRRKCLRVFTIEQDVATNTKKAEADLDIAVVSANLAQMSGRLAKQGKYEDALAYATSVQALIQKRVNLASPSDKDIAALWTIFQSEYNEITKMLNAAISQETLQGLSTSASDRSGMRSDATAHKLYSYQAANKQACVLQ